MERLIAGTPNDEDLSKKEFYLCPCGSIENLGQTISPGSAHFGLFVAMDAHSVSNESIFQGAKELVSKGLAYLCAWGPDCERVHDLFDEEIVEMDIRLATDDDVILTTWHPNESLEEALWFFVHAAFPTQAFEKTCRDWIIAPISNSDWEQMIRSKFAQISSVIEDD